MKIEQMKTKKTLYPGQPGTQKWLKKYGADLLAVRYKYDEKTRTKMISVEIAVETQPWDKNEKKIPPNKIVKIKIEYGEIELGRKVKTFGGKWNRNEKVWEISYGAVVALGLQKRIVRDS